MPTTHALTRDHLVASSAAWVAVGLNLGCQGLGYIYQRRWRAFWLGGCGALAAAVVLGLGAGTGGYLLAEGRRDRTEWTTVAAMVGAYTGFFGVGMGSAVEAGLAVQRARRRRMDQPG